MAEEPTPIPNAFAPVSRDDWRAKVEADLRGKPVSSLSTELEPGITLQPLYMAEDLPASAVPFPGLPPFTRGGEALGKAGDGWLVCQEYDDPRMEVAGAMIKADLENGAGGVWVRMACDAGVRVLTAGDVETVLESVDLRKHAVHLESQSDVLLVASALFAVAEARGVPHGELRGGLGADPLATLAETGTLPDGYEAAARTMVELARFCSERAPGVKAVCVSSRPYADAGANATQELAYVLATSAEYLRRLIGAGLSPDAAAQQMSLSLSVSSDFFAQIAKLRAARTLFAKVTAAFGASAEAQTTTLHARTASFNKTRRDPWVNMLRATTETAAAAIGGADSVATGAFDELCGPSDGFARRVARNTHVVLRDESHLSRVADPAGGSWFIESLSDQLARAAWALFQSIEGKGGMRRALGAGLVHTALAEGSAAQRRAVATRRTAVVGVNEFPNLTEQSLARSPVSLEDVEGELGNPFGRGTPDERQDLLLRLARAARGTSEAGTLVPAAIAATLAGVDMMNLGTMLRDGFPSLHVEPLPRWHVADAWEALRDASDTTLARDGRRPRAFLAQLGPIPEHKARGTWTANLLAAGGIESAENEGFADASAALAAYDGSEVVVFVGKDERYDDAVELSDAFRKAGAKQIVVAGKVPDKQEQFRAQGVDTFLYAGADALETLSKLHAELEVAR
ncbi:MAG: methylmalonyl-CoA mutase subunit beta [Polyangiales bacterium]|nr:methylmalonyl-CoA mutase small subunit [Myxococcales bacterium]MCB9661282.1 methylmalonyl-CoA mutase small subunit [Sandaracinaceae bacterium]